MQTEATSSRTMAESWPFWCEKPPRRMLCSTRTRHCRITRNPRTQWSSTSCCGWRILSHWLRTSGRVDGDIGLLWQQDRHDSGMKSSDDTKNRRYQASSGSLRLSWRSRCERIGFRPISYKQLVPRDEQCTRWQLLILCQWDGHVWFGEFEGYESRQQ